MRRKKVSFIIISLMILFFILINSACESRIASIEETICIGKNSFLFVSNNSQSYKQLVIFSNISYLQIIDCNLFPYDCNEITTYPTWVINNKVYTGYLSLDSLKKLTSC